VGLSAEIGLITTYVTQKSAAHATANFPRFSEKQESKKIKEPQGEAERGKSR